MICLVSAVLSRDVMYKSGSSATSAKSLLVLPVTQNRSMPMLSFVPSTRMAPSATSVWKARRSFEVALTISARQLATTTWSAARARKVRATRQLRIR